MIEINSKSHSEIERLVAVRAYNRGYSRGLEHNKLDLRSKDLQLETKDLKIEELKKEINLLKSCGALEPDYKAYNRGVKHTTERLEKRISYLKAKIKRFRTHPETILDNPYEVFIHTKPVIRTIRYMTDLFNRSLDSEILDYYREYTNILLNHGYSSMSGTDYVDFINWAEKNVKRANSTDRR